MIHTPASTVAARTTDAHLLAAMETPLRFANRPVR
jgi:hypothetical protein